MKLELHSIKVHALAWGEKTEINDGVLSINRQELIDHLSEDERLGGVDVELVHPGDSTRIIPVKDVVEPRCKLEGDSEVFPGFIGDVDSVGEGKTLVLSGAAVVTTGRIVATQEGIIDMSGPGAEYTPYSRTCNVTVILEPADPDLEKHSYEEACRMAGLKASTYLAKSAVSVSADAIGEYEFAPLSEGMSRYPELPRVAYMYMLQSQGLLHDTYVYGHDAKKTLPTLISPTEVFDGAVVSGNCVSACDKNNTYAHLNNPVIEGMFARHGKDFNFVGVILTNENVTLEDKERSSSYAVKLARLLGVDGVLISQEGFGNPDADLVANCWKAERSGIKTTLITDEYAGRDGASQGLADACKEGDAVVSVGNANETVDLPVMDKVLGYPEEADVIDGGWYGSLHEDGSISVEIQTIIGATNQLGYTNNGAYTL
ncbi:MAG: glycine/sarcosine/betaine reductase component B subunit [Synergistales bacterium]|nr:glycine/sarcosine/betaine reductase component B subunit [Synergistales bacterium]